MHSCAAMTFNRFSSRTEVNFIRFCPEYVVYILSIKQTNNDINHNKLTVLKSSLDNQGALLLDTNLPREAEQVRSEDLAIYPDNGWSLWGLAQSLKLQGQESEAKTVEQQFNSAWKYADTDVSSMKI